MVLAINGLVKTSFLSVANISKDGGAGNAKLRSEGKMRDRMEKKYGSETP